MPTLDIEKEIRRLRLALQKQKAKVQHLFDSEDWHILKEIIESIIRIEANIQYYKTLN